MIKLALFGAAAIGIGVAAFWAGRNIARPAPGISGGFFGARPVTRLDGPSKYYLEIN